MLLRQMSVCFLIDDNNKILMLKKNIERDFLPGKIVPVGGHINPQEISQPTLACQREIFEETGIKRSEIHDLRLKYIIMRNKSDKEIRIQYVHFGKIKNDVNYQSSSEGEIIKLPIEEIGLHNVTESTKFVINHYLNSNNQSNEIFTGTIHSLNNIPQITWSKISDWIEVD